MSVTLEPGSLWPQETLLDERTPVDHAVLDGSLPFAHAARPFEPDPRAAHALYREQLESIRRIGPMSILRAVTV